jgi:hypothetical protein
MKTYYPAATDGDNIYLYETVEEADDKAKALAREAGNILPHEYYQAGYVNINRLGHLCGTYRAVYLADGSQHALDTAITTTTLQAERHKTDSAIRGGIVAVIVAVVILVLAVLSW